MEDTILHNDEQSLDSIYDYERTVKANQNVGYQSIAYDTADYGDSINKGMQSVSVCTGDYSDTTNASDYSISANTGNQSFAQTKGCQSIAVNTGCKSTVSAEGVENIAVATGFKSAAKANINCWLVLAEWNDEANHIVDVKSCKVDGNIIKADTFYTLHNGEFCEA